MARSDIDPVLQQLTQAINESGQAAAPGLLGKAYTKDAEEASGRHLHIRGTGVRGDGTVSEGLRRISSAAVDAWTLRTGTEDDRPFAS